MMIKSILGMLLVLLLPLGQAHAIILDNWDDVDLDGSGDYINVETGVLNGDTWFSLQWQAGADNALAALGIDTVFYNCVDCSFTNRKDDDATTLGGVKAVWLDAIGIGGTDVTASWETNFGSVTPGGGFGEFSSRKGLDSAGTDGIDNVLYFLLNGSVIFEDNGDPNSSTFAAHVRYEDDCSGWVSDGNTQEAGSGSCGMTVPEPSIMWLLGSGLLIMGFAKRKKA